MSARRHEGAAAAVEAHDWARAVELLLADDRREPLGAEELLLLADAARWSGAGDVQVDALERAHAAFTELGDGTRAARTALLLLHANLDLGRTALAAGWRARAAELLASEPEGPDHGLLAWYEGRAAGDRGDLDAHEACARRAFDLARRHGDRSLEALARLDIGNVAAACGRTVEALEELDLAIALTLAGEVGRFETGLVFCNAIWACKSRGEWDRASEWTDSATRWVAREQIGYFPALCRVHRSEVLRIRGRLEEAEVEAFEAVRLLEETIPRWVVAAHAELGEVRRRRGDLAGALQAFRRALELGWDPEPGLALCLAAQGDAPAAHRTLERVLHAVRPTHACQDRADLLLARVTLAIEVDERALAEAGVDELEALAEREGRPWDAATAALARGRLELARGRPEDSVASLLEARGLWSELDAPYELATTCAVLGRALLHEGDGVGARLALEAGRQVFERIGAHHDRAQVERDLAQLEESGRGTRASADSPSPGEAALLREGDSWAIAADGREVRLRDSLGLRYLALLVESPDTDHAALALAAGDGPLPAGDVDHGPGGALLDDEARRRYRRRLAELEEELADAERDHDVGRAERLAEEKQALLQDLSRTLGLGGRARRAPGPAERARQSVTKALRGAIRRIASEHAWLGRHLQACVRTGAVCRYEPDPDRPIAWRVVR